MRHIILVTILALAATVSIFAQTGQEKTSSEFEMKTVFGHGAPKKLGWFVGIDPGYTQFDGRDVWMGGITAGIIIDHNLSVGLLGRAWVNRNGLFYPEVTDTAGAYLDGGYGGILLEYTLFPKSMFHVTFPVVIGGGWATYTTEKEYYEWRGNEKDLCHRTIDSDAFFVVEPGIRAEINLQKFMRLSAGVSYRYVGGLQLVNTPSTLMNNFTATIGLKFGKF